ncbi:transporter substrate-binding domain-containing protein [Nitrospirillum sp. BR 11828]|uniref:transporter substrate-binding domain-containing protein n=1 Tax=Nitrospirillum sp. BR 11828 TaxID=3104325 RepID=UPI002ACAA56A|nr:transporter substrate-binding domain-containing protein [Nitrospirillum sp. BR 11828]MDZ5646689.1 transporter substrate-binding domain-containing protein [Nitrospirillum sp. BR 11828]
MAVWLLLGLMLVLGAAPARAAAKAPVTGGTLDQVRQRGVLRCGVNTGLPGFGTPDSNGEWSGLDVDVCRAVAAAVLGDARKVQFIPLGSRQRFSSLAAGEIDLLSRNTTWTLSRDVQGLEFAPPVYYDGQAFMVRRSFHARSVRELDGATICVQQGTTTEVNLADYFQSTGMKYTPGHRGSGGTGRRLFRRPLRRLHHRRVGPGRHPCRPDDQRRRLPDPARTDLEGAAGARREKG